MFRVNVSSVQSFAQCRFRWWCEYVMNRVPVNTAPALDSGRLLHKIFEDAFLGLDITYAAKTRCDEFKKLIDQSPQSTRYNALKALSTIEDLIEAFPLWEDKFKVDEVLEVEEAFEWHDPVGDFIWIGRPDRVIRSGKRIWHAQNRGLAASMNFATYCRLALRNYHEHLYAEALFNKYRGARPKKGALRYGGTVFNLIRKLKYRTNVGKKNEATKTAEEMFYQQAVSYDITSPLHKSVMQTMRQHVEDMRHVIRRWEDDQIVPAPNDKLNGGYSGSAEDPYFKVLIGEVKLSDPTVFKDRESQYEIKETSAE